MEKQRSGLQKGFLCEWPVGAFINYNLHSSTFKFSKNWSAFTTIVSVSP